MRKSSILMPFASVFALLLLPLAAHAADDNKLEVFSWWTSGGEAAALEALFNVYQKQAAGVEIVNRR
jgi:glucose/mannose transport system substrate-binding protein